MDNYCSPNDKTSGEEDISENTVPNICETGISKVESNKGNSGNKDMEERSKGEKYCQNIMVKERIECKKYPKYVSKYGCESSSSQVKVPVEGNLSGIVKERNEAEKKCQSSTSTGDKCVQRKNANQQVSDGDSENKLEICETSCTEVIVDAESDMNEIMKEKKCQKTIEEASVENKDCPRKSANEQQITAIQVLGHKDYPEKIQNLQCDMISKELKERIEYKKYPKYVSKYGCESSSSQVKVQVEGNLSGIVKERNEAERKCQSSTSTEEVSVRDKSVQRKNANQQVSDGDSENKMEICETSCTEVIVSAESDMNEIMKERKCQKTIEEASVENKDCPRKSANEQQITAIQVLGHKDYPEKTQNLQSDMISKELKERIEYKKYPKYVSKYGCESSSSQVKVPVEGNLSGIVKERNEAEKKCQSSTEEVGVGDKSDPRKNANQQVSDGDSENKMEICETSCTEVALTEDQCLDNRTLRRIKRDSFVKPIESCNESSKDKLKSNKTRPYVRKEGVSGKKPKPGRKRKKKKRSVMTEAAKKYLSDKTKYYRIVDIDAESESEQKIDITPGQKRRSKPPTRYEPEVVTKKPKLSKKELKLLRQKDIKQEIPLLSKEDIKQEIIPSEEMYFQAPLVAESGDISMNASADQGEIEADIESESNVPESSKEQKRVRKPPNRYEAYIPKKQAKNYGPEPDPCSECFLKHEAYEVGCPYLNPFEVIQDNVIHEIGGGNTSYKPLATLPFVLGLRRHSSNGFSVFASFEIEPFTQFGPVKGKIVNVKEVSIDPHKMPFLWIGREKHWLDKSKEESDEGSKLPERTVPERHFIDTSVEDESNWCRFLRVFEKDDGEQYNMIAVRKADDVFLVTTRKIDTGEELLYHIPYIDTSSQFKLLDGLSCKFCKKDFQSLIDAFKHVHIFHRNFKKEVVKCDICFETFMTKKALRNHCRAEHAGRGAFHCEICGRHYLRREVLNQHEKDFHSDTIYSCHLCDLKTKRSQTLQEHIKFVHGKNPLFQCPDCPVKMKYKGSMIRHRKIHESDSCPHFCDQCGKGFRDTSNLKVHMLTHTGEKPWKCKEYGCDAAYTTKQCLQKHIKSSHPNIQIDNEQLVKSV